VNTYDDSFHDRADRADRADGSGRHPLSAGYLVAGLVFLGIAGTWALRAAEIIDDEGSRWVVPIVLIVAGVAGLAASLARSAVPRRHETTGPDDLPLFDDPGDEADRGADPLAR
jgi:hypothetical protein